MGVLKFRVNRHKTYSLNSEPGVQKRTILYSLYSMTETNYAAKIPLTVQFLKGIKKTVTQLTARSLSLNSSISAQHVFIAVRYGGPQGLGKCRFVICFLLRIYKLEILSLEIPHFKFRNSKF